MSTAVSPDFIAGVLPEYRERVGKIVLARRRLEVTRTREFVAPFETSVVYGLFSGENGDGWFNKKMKLAACYSIAEDSYSIEWFRKEMRGVVEAIDDIFSANYRLGADFGKVRRDGRIGFSDEGGTELIGMMVKGLEINVDDGRGFARSLWRHYAAGQRHRTFPRGVTILPRLFFQ